MALLVLFLGASALMSGVARGENAAGGTCSDESFPANDTWLGLGDEIFVGVDHTTPSEGHGPAYGVWTCYAVTGGEAQDQNTGVGTWDTNTSTTGRTVEVVQCPPGPGVETNCFYVLAPTGAELDVTPSINPPLSGAPGTGASVGAGPGTCIYLHGTATCATGEIAAVTVNEADLVPTVTPHVPTPPCVGVDNTCLPNGAAVRLFQDTANPTVEVRTIASPTPTAVDVDPSGMCVQVNSVC